MTCDFGPRILPENIVVFVASLPRLSIVLQVAFMLETSFEAFSSLFSCQFSLAFH